MADVGLLRRLSLLAPSAFGEGNRLFVEFKGALSENYVLQALQHQFEATPRYWTMENPRYEVDFLIQRENDILPVEVKSDSNVESRSLKKYKEKYGDKVNLRVLFSLNNLRLDDDLLNIPLFMADYAISFREALISGEPGRAKLVKFMRFACIFSGILSYTLMK